MIRIASTTDYRRTEELTREVFWNKYHPGCSEHYILHRFRENKALIPELDLVMERKNQIVGHIMYCEGAIELDAGGTCPLVVFGPVSIDPACQGQGLGAQLISYSMDQAARMGYGAVAITGSPDYYHRFGFLSGSRMGIYYHGMSRTEEAPFFMVRELKPGYLRNVKGTFRDPAGYYAEDADVERFDQRFPPKVKQKLPGQLEP